MTMPAVTTCSAVRLCAAADMLLDAIRSTRGVNSLVTMYAGSRPDSGMMPADAFTADELIEAMELLIRLGLTPPLPSNPRSVPAASSGTTPGRNTTKGLTPCRNPTLLSRSVTPASIPLYRPQSSPRRVASSAGQGRFGR